MLLKSLCIARRWQDPQHDSLYHVSKKLFGRDGKPVTDGVFPEPKEFLAGYWIMAVPSRQRAYEIAAEASTAPGSGAQPLQIEVREVVSAPP